MATANLLSTETPNINISAYRVLYILLLLVRYRSLNTRELEKHLIENPLIGKNFSSETISKYVNTLREVGCIIPKANNRHHYCYKLLKNPFPLIIEPDEAAIAEKLLVTLAQQPDEHLLKDYRDFLEYLSWSANLSSLNAPKSAHSTQDIELFPQLAHHRRLLNTYRNYCQDAFRLLVTYQGKSRQIEPQEVIERGDSILLAGVDYQSQDNVTLDIRQIDDVQQLPSKNRRGKAQSTITFALYDRLAKSYRLYTDEQVIYCTEKEVHIKTTVADRDALLSRLMKYGAACQILSPEKLRDTMRERIKRLLAHLSQPSVAG
jgi:predicted DNA-binding transcriptional regulator YafY